MDLIISTKETVEQAKSIKYIGFVDSNLVLGINILAEFAAGITDIFGGRSSGYQDRINNITQTAKKEIEVKAKAMGANAILGFRININQLTGKDKSMLMVSTYGTACLIDIELPKRTSNIIYASEISAIEEKSNLLNKKLTDKDIEYIADNNIIELSDKYIDYFETQTVAEFNENNIGKYFLRYFNGLEFDHAINIIYSYIENNHNTRLFNIFTALCADLNLIDYKKLIQLLDTNQFIPRKFVFTLHKYTKKTYTTSDIEDIKKLILKLENLSDISTTTTEKTILGKEKQLWICADCKTKNPFEAEFCKCDRDKTGIKKQSKDAFIQTLNNKIKILAQLGL